MNFKKLFPLKLISCFILFILSQTIIGQAFVEINAGLTGLSNSSAVWGDYDNDKDPDLLISGQAAGGQNLTLIYNNSNGYFTDIIAGLPGLNSGSVAWGDYDNDGDLDILSTGDSQPERAFIFQNNNGVFTEVNAGLPFFGAYSFACWADYDNDGDLDVFITGNFTSKIYKNLGNNLFADSGSDLAMLNSSRANWGDVDGDGDSDLVLTGDSGGGMKLYIYINEYGSFIQHELPGKGLSAGSVEWGDYDSDGDLDILIMGFNDYIEPDADIYRNDGDLNFVSIYAGLPPVALGKASWGDCDNDGDLDVAITGKLAGCGIFTSSVYENIGNDWFNDINAGLTNAERSYVAWADYDGDTDLDLLLTGINYSGSRFTKIYRNDFSLPNLLPESPSNLNVEFMGANVKLKWDKGNDPQTLQNGLSYNLRIGTFPLHGNYMSPMAHFEDGYRLVSAIGNTSLNNSWIIKGLEPGIEYFWSVQTVDNTFAGSAFSQEQSFVVAITDVYDEISGNDHRFYPNPASEFIYFKTAGIAGDDEISMINSAGLEVMRCKIPDNRSISLKNFPGGIYFLKLIMDHKVYVEKLILE